MSLSDQLNRVDGSQNIILKAIAKAFGISISNQKIDQVAALVTASPKFGQDALISAATASSLGLAATATPNEAFSKLKSMVDAAQSAANVKATVVTGSYVGDGTIAKTLTFSAPPVLVVCTVNSSDYGFSPTGTGWSYGFIWIKGLQNFLTLGKRGSYTLSGNTLTIANSSDFSAYNQQGFAYSYIMISGG